MADLQGIAENVIKGNAPEVERLVREAIDEGVGAAEILNQGLVAGMNVVGDKFKKNEFYVPEVLIAARAMKAGMALLRPLLADTGVKPVAKFLIGTVKGDLHDIGKNLVAMMMEGAGFQVIDLGIDVPPEKFVEVIKAESPELVGMSALLTTTMISMKDTIEALDRAGVRDKVKVMVGGAPVTQDYADEIGADGYAPDAASAVDKAKELLGL
ncbi:MAG: cobalamin-binding protein [Candidatus Latescibacterota bacterium]|nr:MAG: cobalamin-binding protein [Candidatus Latescibacterota bacterium]RKY63339.1 MAG: cobalamin-binding protein [Candidatus Latescibacterota bacterium]RKY66910.1 MAG: cobalamin-binding protein [Candidatus Latescibacterota bacterium]RKY72927.1 MAG: cobalamin-binding protein [Candidatus Latescibacterota bacterium]HDI00508.1 cobalamin-binding protein [Bacillota bacterium]